MGLGGSEMVHGWRWDNILQIWIKVGQEYDASEAHILKPRWVWDGVCMELGWNIRDLYGVEISPVWRSNANVWTWIEVRHDLDGCEMLIWGPSWSWDATCREVSCNIMDLGGGETVHGCRWDYNLWIWIQWDSIKMEVRCTSWYLDGFQLEHELILKCNGGDLAGGET